MNWLRAVKIRHKKTALRERRAAYSFSQLKSLGNSLRNFCGRVGSCFFYNWSLFNYRSLLYYRGLLSSRLLSCTVSAGNEEKGC